MAVARNRGLTARESTPGLSVQAVRFLGVGVIAAICDFGLLALIMTAGLPHVSAKALSWCVGTIVAYLLNRRWTFGAAPSKRRFAAVASLYAITFVLQVGIFSVLYPLLVPALGTTASQVLAFVIAQGVATVTNFCVQRWVIFAPAPLPVSVR
ncbi:MAG: GtrA family protein [Propionibacteriaceae bacterium]|nr:GtrA family protein [Propionibacteriaceae bacterium]